jgi:hypothetical protein
MIRESLLEVRTDPSDLCRRTLASLSIVQIPAAQSFEARRRRKIIPTGHLLSASCEAECTLQCRMG